MGDDTPDMHDAVCVARWCGAPAVGEYVGDNRTGIRMFMCEEDRFRNRELGRHTFRWVDFVPTAAAAKRIEAMAAGRFG